jgi:hypothetical protein
MQHLAAPQQNVLRLMHVVLPQSRKMRVSGLYGADIMLGSLQSTIRLAAAYAKLNLRAEVRH